jgi:CheY-like chemotaxis protein
VVDDDMRNVFALSAVLESNKMQVLAAGDGRESLEQLKKHPDTDLVLMDIMMPEMDGYEAMQRIRKDLKMAHLPIIALTAKAMAGDRDKCIAAGASDYITKPVEMQKLLSLMRVWLTK